jgi:hypothetical protein
MRVRPESSPDDLALDRVLQIVPVHETFCCTPAMALGVTDHVWTIGELLQAALEPTDVPPLPVPTPDTALRSGYRPFSRS